MKAVQATSEEPGILEQALLSRVATEARADAFEEIVAWLRDDKARLRDLRESKQWIGVAGRHYLADRIEALGKEPRE